MKNKTKAKAIEIKNHESIVALVLALVLICLSILPSGAQTIQTGVTETTPVAIVAEWPIDEGTQIGEHFSARIVEDVVTDTGVIFIPKNSRVLGTVIDVNEAKSFHRNGKIDINFEKIVFPDNITSFSIEADGTIIPDKSAVEKLVKKGLFDTAKGTLIGALAGFKFGGIIGTGSSAASNMAIGAMTGAGLSLISFVAKKGKEVEINPGLPMTLNIMHMQSQTYQAQAMPAVTDPHVKGYVVGYDDNKIQIEIENNLRHSIPLGNIKIIDGLGYTVKPNIAYSYHDIKSIPAKSTSTYEFEFQPSTKDGRFWLVLTDSFGKQEYFRKEINPQG